MLLWFRGVGVMIHRSVYDPARGWEVERLGVARLAYESVSVLEVASKATRKHLGGRGVPVLAG